MRARALWLYPAVGFSLSLCSVPELGATPVHLWSHGFGSVFNGDESHSVAIDAAGDVVITGEFMGSIDFGGGPLFGNGHDVFVAKFDPSGNHLWSRGFGDQSNQSGRSITTDGLGNIIVTGEYAGSIDFGGGPLTCSCVDTLGDRSMFVAKLDGNGGHVWSKGFGDDNVYFSNGVAADPSGNVLVTGEYRGTLDFGGGPLVSNDVDIFVVKFDPNGNHVWSKRFGNAPDQMGIGIAADAAGNVVITGEFEGMVNFGGSTLTSTDDFDTFVAKFDGAGNHVWSHAYSGNADQVGKSIAIRVGGGVVIAGHTGDDVDFGGGNLPSGGGTDVFVAEFTAGGSHVWSRLFGGTDDQRGMSVATDVAGNIFVTGNFAGTIDFGGGPITCDCDPFGLSSNIFVAEFDGGGNHLWSQAFGGPYNNNSHCVATGGGGNIAITGEFENEIDFGGGPIADLHDVFLATFNEHTLPVLITGFEARPVAGAVRVAWEVWSDEAIESYTLYRRESREIESRVVAEGPFRRATRSFTDNDVSSGATYEYILVIHVLSGVDIRSQTATVTVPGFDATLGQNYPNPFRPSTTIEYTLSARSDVTVGIYDAAGRLVVELKEGVLDAGTHQVSWNGRDASGALTHSGVYFYRLEGAANVAPKKMVRLK